MLKHYIMLHVSSIYAIMLHEKPMDMSVQIGESPVGRDEDRLLTVPEVAAHMRVGPEAVRRWLRDGKLAGVSLGHGAGWRIRLGDLEAFIMERRTGYAYSSRPVRE